MRGKTIALLSTCVLVCAAGHRVAAEDAVPAGDSASARALVNEALRCEIDGHNAERQRLLDLSLEQQPNFAPARWQAGYVRVDGHWQSVDDPAELLASNAARKLYAVLRNKTPDDAAGNLRLAQWCLGHKLAEEAGAHFLRVIALAPDNAEARARLGYRQFAGQWMTKDQIAEYQANAKRLRDADTRWRFRLETLRARLVHSSQSIRKAADKELLAINDPDAAAALERYLAGTNAGVDSLLVELLGKLAGTDAALALTRCAVVSPWPEVREAAAKQLRDRNVEIYAPLLLAAMYKPVAQHVVTTAPGGGGVAMRQVVTLERQYGVDEFGQDTLKYVEANAILNTNVVGSVYIQDDGTTSKTNRGPSATQNPAAAAKAVAPYDAFNAQQEAVAQQSVVRWDRQAQLQAAAYLARQALICESRARATEQQIALDAQTLNQRIASTLNTATYQNLATDPSVWWQWWDDYSCLRSGEKPVRVSYSQSSSVTPIGPVVNMNEFAVYHVSCFAAGTLVSTIAGQRPIDSLRIGDLVLAQDAATGELAYKPVLGTSAGPPTQFVQLSAGEETIQCTPNHLFWVEGTGWVPAGELAEATYLHGVRGATPLWRVSQGDKARTFNLVVADSHTYFVGKHPLLVHDNTMWEPAEAVVPGMTH